MVTAFSVASSGSLSLSRLCVQEPAALIDFEGDRFFCGS